VEIYDPVAEAYSAVFNSIELRIFEWPWLKKTIGALRPASLLELGCGNGSLSLALGNLFNGHLELSAVDSSEVMAGLARERLKGHAEVFKAAAEALPFPDRRFDTALSFLSFRYMQWDRALDEIFRVLKDGGIFIMVDLFASSFNPFYFHKYIECWMKTRLQYMRNKDYRKKLLALYKNTAWQEMTASHPKRSLEETEKAIQTKFTITEKKLLSLGLRGKTAALVCRKM
jgi:ubiquinone/menaquinone biosynthesis C-methylase UbiE